MGDSLFIWCLQVTTGAIMISMAVFVIALVIWTIREMFRGHE